jgi:hypothetical protein
LGRYFKDISGRAEYVLLTCLLFIKKVVVRLQDGWETGAVEVFVFPHDGLSYTAKSYMVELWIAQGAGIQMDIWQNYHTMGDRGFG